MGRGGGSAGPEGWPLAASATADGEQGRLWVLQPPCRPVQHALSLLLVGSNSSKRSSGALMLLLALLASAEGSSSPHCSADETIQCITAGPSPQPCRQLVSTLLPPPLPSLLVCCRAIRLRRPSAPSASRSRGTQGSACSAANSRSGRYAHRTCGPPGVLAAKHSGVCQAIQAGPGQLMHVDSTTGAHLLEQLSAALGRQLGGAHVAQHKLQHLWGQAGSRGP